MVHAVTDTDDFNNQVPVEVDRICWLEILAVLLKTKQVTAAGEKLVVVDFFATWSQLLKNN